MKASKIQRNDPCPCHSGKKYKHCCANSSKENVDVNAICTQLMLQAAPHFNNKEYAIAEPIYMQILQMNPSYADAYSQLGGISAAYDMNEQAIALIKTAISYSPRNVIYFNNLGYLLIKTNQFPEALETYKKAITIESSNLAALNGIIQVAVMLGDYPLAELYANKIQKIYPKDAVSRHLLNAIAGKTKDNVSADYIATIFDGYAENFDEHLQELGYRIPEEMAGMIYSYYTAHKGAGNLAILDLGCGTGICAEALRQFQIVGSITGVDLSQKMLAKADEKKLYTSLVCSDIDSFLTKNTQPYDLITAADVFIYEGSLANVFVKAHSALKKGGIFAFSIENGDDSDGYTVRISGRYAHARSYIEQLAAENHFSTLSFTTTSLREERGEAIMGYIVLLQK